MLKFKKYWNEITNNKILKILKQHVDSFLKGAIASSYETCKKINWIGQIVIIQSCKRGVEEGYNKTVI